MVAQWRVLTDAAEANVRYLNPGGGLFCDYYTTVRRQHTFYKNENKKLLYNVAPNPRGVDAVRGEVEDLHKDQCFATNGK